MITIKHSKTFYLQKIYDRTTEESQIRLRVRWSAGLAQFNAGYTINPSKWNSELGRCKRNASNKKGFSASYINKVLQQLEEVSEGVFQTFEVLGEVPTVAAFKAAFNKRLGKPSKTKEDSLTLQKAFRVYITEMTEYKSWSESTIAKHNSLMRLLNDFDANLEISSINSNTLNNYLNFLYSRDLQNTTVKRNLKFVKTFLRWCNSKNYLKSEDWEKFDPQIKTVNHREVVFLTWDELMRLYNFEFPQGKKYLAHARDIFCFCCFTGLRYSDATTLKPEDCHLAENYICVTTQKTDATLKIELNKFSENILKRYLKSFENSAGSGGLFCMTNQRLNEFIKKACFVCSIDTPITKVYFKGAERIEELHPKFELIGTHTARRTFICHALSLGIDAATVMSWTGHSDYKSLQPYVSAVDEIKKLSMAKFDEL